jgi:hypothetical protein
VLKRSYLIYLAFLPIFIAYSFCLFFIDIDPSVFLLSISSGYFILGLGFGVIFRKSFLGGSVGVFPLTFLSWVVAFALFSSSNGFAALVEAFSEGFQNVLIAGLIFSFITFFAVLLTALVFKLFQFVSKRIKKETVAYSY